MLIKRIPNIGRPHDGKLSYDCVVRVRCPKPMPHLIGRVALSSFCLKSDENGFFLLPTVAEAREIAAALLEAAAEIEARDGGVTP